MAEDLARSSGTPEDIIQRVLGQEFLLKCLRKAKFSPDLLQDTADACEINDLNALVLGSGLMSVTEASEKLFLMQDEAITVVSVCRKECLRAGVNFGDGAQLTAEELADTDDEEPAAPAPPPPAPAATPTPPSSSVSSAQAPAAALVSHLPSASNHTQHSKVSPGSHEKNASKLGRKVASGAIPASTTAAAAALHASPSAPAAASSMLPKPSGSKPSDSKTSEHKSGGPRPLEVKPPEPKPLGSKLSEAKPAEPKSVGSKALDAKPSEPRPLVPKPSEVKPSEPRPLQPLLSDTKAEPRLPESSAVAGPESAMQRPIASTPTPSGEQTDPNFLIKPPTMTPAQWSGGAGSSVTSGTPVGGRSHIPKPLNMTPVTPAPGVGTPRERTAAKASSRATPSTLATPPTSSGGASDSGFKPMPAMNGRHTPAASSSAARPPRPSSAPLTARMASTTAPLSKERPVSAVTPPTQPSRLPSYAKPTASHKARVTKEDSDVPSTSSTPPVTFASTNKPLRRIQYMAPRRTTSPEEKKEPKKPVFDNIRSNLLRPTAAFLAWSSGKSKPIKEADMRSSQGLQGDSGALSGRARAPFSAPPKNPTRELSATTGSALSPSATQSSSKSTTTPEPFRLASAERHQKAQEEIARKKEEKARMESHIPKFRASPLPHSVDRATAPGKPEARRTESAQTEA